MSEIDRPFLIFDFDGTLANTIEVGIGIYNEMAGQYGLKTVTAAEVDELRKLNTRALLDELGISRILAVKLGARIKKALHHRMSEVGLMPGTREAILDLHRDGFRLGILTSNSADNVRLVLKRFDLLECFRFIEAGVSLFGKAHRLNNVLKRTGISSRLAMYVGDETRDMEAAREARISGVAVCWGTNGREAMETEGPDYCIDSPHELIDCARRFEAGR